MSAMASKITNITIVYSSVYSDADQRKHQSSAPLAFVREIHRWPVNSPHKRPVTRKMFPFDDVIIWLPGIASQKKRAWTYTMRQPSERFRLIFFPNIHSQYWIDNSAVITTYTEWREGCILFSVHVDWCVVNIDANHECVYLIRTEYRQTYCLCSHRPYSDE